MKRSSDVYLAKLNEEVAELIYKAMSLLDAMENELAETVLRPLVESNNPAALYYMAQFGVRADQGKSDSRRIEQLTRAADMGYPPAIHELAVHYDAGDGVERDPIKAANLFKKAAEAGHPHSQWIHGNDLLMGWNGISKNENLGLQYVQKAADAKFEGAIESMVDMHASGKFGFPIDAEIARVWEARLDDPDVLGY